MNLYRRLMGHTDHKAGGCLAPKPTSRKPISYAILMPSKLVLPAELSYIREIRPRENQGNVGACAAFATCAILQQTSWRDSGVPVDYKEIPLYNRARVDDGLDDANEGTTLIAAVAAAETLKYCSYYESYEVKTRDELRFAVWQNRSCLVGLRITDAWNRVDSKGLIPDGGTPIGGHAIVAVGYTSYGPVFANSWGEGWGLFGFGQLSWESYELQLIQALAVRFIL
ncbi:MAG: hypothetical protein ACOYOU_15100 [Kiritimatiellia bacterium]